MRRITDLAVCLVLLVPVSAFIALLALIIALIDGFAPFYLQKRVGRNGVLFTCYKLQTMRSTADTSLIGETERDGERLTKLGEFLRDHGWDELPQIWNVLRGDMGLIGPRPLLSKTIARIREKNADVPERIAEWERVRSDVRPGISGWHQIYCGTDASLIARELEYLRSGSWRHKLAVPFMTLAIFLFGKEYCRRFRFVSPPVFLSESGGFYLPAIAFREGGFALNEVEWGPVEE